MNILHVIPAFAPAYEYGGPIPVAMGMTKYLTLRGHIVNIWTTNLFARVSPAHEILNDVEIKRFKNLFSITKPLLMQFPLQMVNYAKSHLCEFDIIHLHELRTFCNVFVSNEAQRLGVPYLITGHGTVPQKPGKLIKKFFDIILGKRLLVNASKLLALSETEIDHFLKIGANADQLYQLPNGINISDYPFDYARGKFRKKFQIDSRIPIILFMGRLHKTKNPLLALDAFLIVSRSIPQAIMVFAGPDDGEKDLLKKKVSEYRLEKSVVFTGMISGQDKLSALADADIFVTPEFTGFPVSFLEAAAMCTPIITTYKGDKLPWIDEAGKVTNADACDMAQEIIKLLLDPIKLKEKSLIARAIVEERFNWSQIVIELEDLYYSIDTKR